MFIVNKQQKDLTVLCVCMYGGGALEELLRGGVWRGDGGVWGGGVVGRRRCGGGG
jgi:hypothetical protein